MQPIMYPIVAKYDFFSDIIQLQSSSIKYIIMLVDYFDLGLCWSVQSTVVGDGLHDIIGFWHMVLALICKA